MNPYDDRFDPPTPAAQGVVPGPGAMPPPPPNNTSGSTVRTAAIAALVTVVVVGIIGGAYMLGRSGGDDIVATESTTTTSSSTTTEATTTTTTTKVTTSTTAAPPTTIAAPLGNVLQEPDGLLCKDLEAKGYSYSAAVDYWRSHGQPNRMDSDRNGIPCETVYPRSDVVAYWPHSVYDATPSYGYPSGLLCRDLASRGADVYDALRYFIWEGYPSRMDADGNGIPCETVYPDAAEVWLWDF